MNTYGTDRIGNGPRISAEAAANDNITEATAIKSLLLIILLVIYGYLLDFAHDDAAIPGEFEDPTEEVLKFRFRPVLLQVLGNTDGVSGASVNAGTLLSHREKHTGNGGEDLMKNSHGYPEADAVVMDEYIMEKCGCYRESAEKMRLKYQTEYVLFGKDSDADRVQIMTMHAAKGLQFPVVFVAAGFTNPTAKEFDECRKQELRDYTAKMMQRNY